MKPINVKCTSCKGTGKVALTKAQIETLSVFEKDSDRWTAAEVHYCQPAGSKVTVNACNNRLERLRVLGLLKRQPRGRHWEYRRLKKGEKPDEIESNPDRSPKLAILPREKKAKKPAQAARRGMIR